MAKPTSLTPEALTVLPSIPAAATPPRGGKTRQAPKPANDTPLQIRLPKSEARAIKIAAAEADQSISEFMLACFHACMQSRKRANG